jgi:hypothetical protein
VKPLEHHVPVELRDALDSYLAARRQLVDLGVIRTRRSLEADYAEWLMAEMFQLRLSPSSIQEGYDAFDVAGLKYQVKARLVSSLSSSTSFDFSSTPHPFDFLLAVLLAPSLDLLAVLRVACDDVLAHANRNRSTLRLRYTRALLRTSWVEVLFLATPPGSRRPNNA